MDHATTKNVRTSRAPHTHRIPSVSGWNPNPKVEKKQQPKCEKKTLLKDA